MSWSDLEYTTLVALVRTYGADEVCSRVAEIVTAELHSHPVTSIPGPAAWASYLVNGDASGLEPDEKAKADAWLKREGVQIIGTEVGATPYFTNGMRIYAPELDCDGGSLLDYIAVELTIPASEM